MIHSRRKRPLVYNVKENVKPIIEKHNASKTKVFNYLSGILLFDVAVDLGDRQRRRVRAVFLYDAK